MLIGRTFGLIGGTSWRVRGSLWFFLNMQLALIDGLCFMGYGLTLKAGSNVGIVGSSAST